MNNDGQKLTVPGAIIAAGIIIAVAVIYTGGKSVTTKIIDSNNPETTVATKKALQDKLSDNLKPVTTNDHILGNPNAQVKIVEFTDIECPFCKIFHPTIHQIMAEYGRDGKVAWVYRHFPLSFHPKAITEAIASECIHAQGGDGLFWIYVDKLFAAVESNNKTDLAILPVLAKEVGANVATFNACLSSEAHKAKIEADIEDGLAAGVSGTPYTIVVAANGKKFPINGALPLEDVRAVIELALKEK